MSQQDQHVCHPQSREPLSQLVNVPVDVEYLKKVVSEVESHGGKGTRTSQYETFSLFLGKRTFCLYTFDFPPGTYREFGLTEMHATPFMITFPDGGVIYGTLLVRPNAPAGEPPTAILHPFR